MGFTPPRLRGHLVAPRTHTNTQEAGYLSLSLSVSLPPSSSQLPYALVSSTMRCQTLWLHAAAALLGITAVAVPVQPGLLQNPSHARRPEKRQKSGL